MGFFHLLNTDLLLRWRILLRRILWLRLIHVVEPSASRRGIVLRVSKAVAEAIAEAAAVPVLSVLTILSVDLAVQILLSAHHLDRRLVRGGDQETLIKGGIVDKLPLVIFFLVIVFANRRVLAGAGDSDDGCAAKLSIQSRGSASGGASAVGGSNGIRSDCIRGRIIRLSRARSRVGSGIAGLRRVLSEQRIGISAKAAVPTEGGGLSGPTGTVQG